MRIKTLACLMFTACAFMLGGCSHFEKTVTKKVSVEVPPKLVFLGDSIPSGYGLEGYSYDDVYHSRSYCNIIGEEYTQELESSCGHEMINLAVMGTTSSRLLEQLSGGEFDDALKDSDAVVISIGGNDLLDLLLEYIEDNVGYDYDDGSFHWEDLDVWGTISGFVQMGEDMDTALDGFEKNLPEIISLIDERTEGEIYVQTLYDPFEAVKIPFVADMASEKIGRLNKIINNCAEYGSTHYYTVIDIVSGFKGRSKELTNINDIDIHPNVQGHAVIATLVDEQLRTGSYSYDTEEIVTDTPKLIKTVGVSAGAVIALMICIIALVKKLRSRRVSPDAE